MTKGHTRLPVGGRQVFGHILTYVLFRGVIPRGRILHHMCETPDCWNPWHLEAISNRDHRARHTAQRSACPQGHAYPENAFRDPSGSMRCRICTRVNKERAKQRSKAARQWRCVQCGAIGMGDKFPLVSVTTRQCAGCGAKGGHKVKPYGTVGHKA